MTVSHRTAIQVEDLHRSYRRSRRMTQALLHPMQVEWVEALKGVSFDVAEGEVLGILGPNGAGKTSLIKILSTLVLPSRGTARVFGHDVADDSAAVRSRVGLVLADERSFYWRLTVRQNLMFFATLNGLERGQRAGRIEELLETVDAQEWGDRAFSDLSAGIRQRVALARAMLNDPALLLMDEPTNSLDPHAAESLRSWIHEELVDRRGKTLLLVTHDAGEAAEVCDRIGILKRGRMVFLGTPSQLESEQGRAAGHRLRVTGWTDGVAAALAEAGLHLRVCDSGAGANTGVELEVELDASDSDLTEAFGVLARKGLRVQTCERRTARFSELVAELLGPEEAAS